MARPFTNIKNYEMRLRETEDEPIVKLSKLGVYQKILKAIDKEYEKITKKIDLLSKKRGVVVNLIFKEKDKILCKK